MLALLSKHLRLLLMRAQGWSLARALMSTRAWMRALVRLRLRLRLRMRMRLRMRLRIQAQIQAQIGHDRRHDRAQTRGRADLTTLQRCVVRRAKFRKSQRSVKRCSRARPPPPPLPPPL